MFPYPSSHLKADMVRDGVDRPVSKPPEFPELDQPHAGMVQPAVIPERHDTHRPQFIQFPVGPIVQPLALPPICHASNRQQHCFLYAFHRTSPAPMKLHNEVSCSFNLCACAPGGRAGFRIFPRIKSGVRLE